MAPKFPESSPPMHRAAMSACACGVSMTNSGRQFVCTVYSSESDVRIVDLLDGST